MNTYHQICFVYKWTQLSTAKWYIGSHTSKTAHPDDGYICSSKIVKPMILENPNDWVRSILETGTAKTMVELEHELLTCLNAAKSEYSYNRTNGSAKFSSNGFIHSNEAKCKMSIARKGVSKSDEHRVNMSNASKGKTKSDTHRANMSKARSLQHKIECPHCSKTGSITTMKRWHYDNCKLRT